MSERLSARLGRITIAAEDVVGLVRDQHGRQWNDFYLLALRVMAEAFDLEAFIREHPEMDLEV